MKSAVAWFARNNVAANLLMLVFVVGGLVALPTIPQKTFPDIDIDMVSIAVEYLGAAPEEVEEGVARVPFSPRFSLGPTSIGYSRTSRTVSTPSPRFRPKRKSRSWHE